MSRPKSDLEALRQDLHKVYDGDPWHGSSITEVLKGIDAEVAAKQSIPHAHTIWEIVLHMTAWTREVASRVRGAVAKSPPEGLARAPIRRRGAGMEVRERRSGRGAEGDRSSCRCATGGRSRSVDRKP